MNLLYDDKKGLYLLIKRILLFGGYVFCILFLSYIVWNYFPLFSDIQVFAESEKGRFEKISWMLSSLIFAVAFSAMFLGVQIAERKDVIKDMKLLSRIYLRYGIYYIVFYIVLNGIYWIAKVFGIHLFYWMQYI